MNIHEYQGKEILKKYGVAIQRGVVADTPESAIAGAKELQAETGTKWFVIKAQIHAGGRGKGTVNETGSKGVVLAKSIAEVPDKVKGILGGTLVTIQTGAEGKKVNKVSPGRCSRCRIGNAPGPMRLPALMLSTRQKII